MALRTEPRDDRKTAPKGYELVRWTCGHAAMPYYEGCCPSRLNPKHQCRPLYAPINMAEDFDGTSGGTDAAD